MEDYKEISKGPATGKYVSGAGLPITCLHCHHDHFMEGKALLNSRAATFFGLDWLNDAAITLTCTRCGYIHWFGKQVKKVGPGSD